RAREPRTAGGRHRVLGVADWDRSRSHRDQNGVRALLQVSLGVGLVFFGHALFLALVALLSGLYAEDLLGSGPTAGIVLSVAVGALPCTQCVYVGPTLVGALWVRRRPIALGVVLGAVLTPLGQWTLFVLAFTAMQDLMFSTQTIRIDHPVGADTG